MHLCVLFSGTGIAREKSKENLRVTIICYYLFFLIYAVDIQCYKYSLFELRKHRIREVECLFQRHTENTELKSSRPNSHALSSGHGGLLTSCK